MFCRIGTWHTHRTETREVAMVFSLPVKADFTTADTKTSTTDRFRLSDSVNFHAIIQPTRVCVCVCVCVCERERERERERVCARARGCVCRVIRIP
jgi:hypothetical protein